MANRFAVATGTYDNTNTAIWSATSGGAPGSSVPGLTDNAKFDAASGAITITVSGTRTGVLMLDFTGYTGTLAGTASPDLRFQANGATLSGSMTWSMGGILRSATGAGGGLNRPLTSNGLQINSQLAIANTGTVNQSVTLQDAFSSTVDIALSTTSTGTVGLDANNFSVTCSSVGMNGTNASITMGSGTWTLTGTGTVWGNTAGTITANTSTIKTTDASGGTLTFAGNGATYYNLWLSGAGSENYTVTGANTFHDIRCNEGTTAHTITFPNSTTTVTTFTVAGTSGKLVTLQRTGGSGSWTLSSSADLSCDYLSISNCTKSGGGKLYCGTHSTDGGGNSADVIFTDPPSGTIFIPALSMIGGRAISV